MVPVLAVPRTDPVVTTTDPRDGLSAAATIQVAKNLVEATERAGPAGLVEAGVRTAKTATGQAAVATARPTT